MKTFKRGITFEKARIAGIDCYVSSKEAEKMRRRYEPTYVMHQTDGTKEDAPSKEEAHKKLEQEIQSLVDREMRRRDKLADEATVKALRRYGYDVIRWHSYPKEKPQGDGWHLVKFRDGDGRLGIGMSKPWEGKFDGDIILEWAECPEPCLMGEETVDGD